jgi:hypothetical protein
MGRGSIVHQVGGGRAYAGQAFFNPLAKIGFICGDQGTQLKSPATISGVVVCPQTAKLLKSLLRDLYMFSLKGGRV